MRMNSSSVRIRATAFFLALTLFGCAEPNSREPDDAIDRSADEAAIRALLAANAAASTARNYAGVAATYTEDGDAWIAGLGSEPTAGREAIASMEKAFNSMPGFQTWDGQVHALRFISRDAAIAEIIGTTTLESGRYQEGTTIVVARSSEGWRIAAWRVMDFDDSLLKLLQN